MILQDIPIVKIRSEFNFNPEFCKKVPSGKNCNIASSPADPIKKVIKSWLMLPAVFSSIPFSRLPGESTIIRPANSPVRLGVIIPRLTPIRMDFASFNMESSSILRVKIFHFITSIPQFRSINSNTVKRRETEKGENFKKTDQDWDSEMYSW